MPASTVHTSTPRAPQCDTPHTKQVQHPTRARLTLADHPTARSGALPHSHRSSRRSGRCRRVPCPGTRGAPRRAPRPITTARRTHGIECSSQVRRPSSLRASPCALPSPSLRCSPFVQHSDPLSVRPAFVSWFWCSVGVRARASTRTSTRTSTSTRASESCRPSGAALSFVVGRRPSAVGRRPSAASARALPPGRLRRLPHLGLGVNPLGKAEWIFSILAMMPASGGYHFSRFSTCSDDVCERSTSYQPGSHTGHTGLSGNE